MKLRARRRRRSLIEVLESRVLMDVTFSIDTTQGQQAISPYIYGTNYGQASAFTGYTFARVGGNRWTAYNWTNNASNAGSDWLYQNDNFLGGGTAPGGAVASIIVDVGNHNAPLVLTVPTNGYLAADKNGPTASDGSDRFTGRFVQEQARKGTAFTLTPPGTGTVYQDEFVNWVKQTYPATQTNSVRPVWYSLDNEPDLWASTHSEVHPAAPTYAEMIQKTVEYASAIKDVSSISLVFGPVNFGWSGMMDLQGAPDKSVAGSLNFQQYYLQQVHNAEVAAGRKLLDVDDVHYYSEAQDTNGHRVTDGYTDAPAIAARVQAARSLYDPTYVESSWITQWSTGGKGIDLLHRMQNDIATYDPGTRIGLTEYNIGGGGHVSGAIAEAEALGAFGKMGVFAASYWQVDTDASYAVAALNMYRNFDGSGSKFGDTTTSASTSSMDQSAIFASVDSSDPTRIVLVALNRTGTALTGHFNLSSLGPLASGHWYALTGSGTAIQDMGGVTISGGSGFDLSLPAYSVNTIALTVTVTGVVAAPTFSPVAGTYGSPKSVLVTTTTPGATIRYTTDGSIPTSTYGTIYTGPVPVSASLTLKAIAYKTGMTDSAVRSGTYTISASTPVYVYQDALAADWNNWSWSSTVDFANTSPVHGGTKSIAVTATAGWSALSLDKGTALSTAGYSSIKFWVHGGTGSNKSLQFYSQTGDSTGTSPSVAFTAVANAWTEITIPLSSLGNPTTIKRINFQNATANTQTVIYFDDIRLYADPANLTPADIALSSTTSAENRPIGSLVGTLNTYDPDLLDTFTYTLVSGIGAGDNSAFTISGTQLLTAASFDYETRGSYAIRVRTTDQGGLWFEKAFIITVTNVNEAPTDLTLSATSIAENRPSATAVGTLATVDPDAGDTFTYTLVTGTGSTDNASFTIAGSTLKTAASFNYEAKSSYAIRVRTTDAGGLWFEKAFTINILNVAEVVPTISSITTDTGTSGTDHITSDRTLLLGGTSEPGMTIKVYRGGVLAGSTTANGSGAWTFDYTGTSLADGSYNFTATASDTLGNTTAASAPFVVTIDGTAPALPTLSINDGAAQRSMVKKLTLTFAEKVVLGTGAATLKFSDGTSPANVAATLNNPSGDQKTYVMTFSGTGATGGSIPDGIYDIAVSAAGVQDLAGNLMTGSFTQRFHRLYGDYNGDKKVNNTDYFQFQKTLGLISTDVGYLALFDYNGDNRINNTDYFQFQKRLGTTWTY